MTLSLAGLAALAVAMGIGRFAFTPLLPLMQADAGLDLHAGAWLASANYLGYLAGALSARRLGSLRSGLAVIAVTTLAMAPAQPLLPWALWRALSGVASAWVLVHVSAYCLARGANAGVVYAGVGAGIFAAGLLTLALDSSAHGWVLLGMISGAVAAALWRHGGPRERAGAAAPSWQHASLIAAYGSFGFGYIIPATFIPAMAREFVADPSVFGWAWPLFGAAAALSTLAANPLIGRFGACRVWLVSQLLMAGSVAAPALFTGLAGVLLSACGVGATFMVITMAGMREAVRVSRSPAGLMAAMTAAFALGQIGGPLVLAAGVAVNVSLLCAAAVLAAGALPILKGANHERTTAAA